MKKQEDSKQIKIPGPLGSQPPIDAIEIAVWAIVAIVFICCL